jgi:hypothetical protein
MTDPNPETQAASLGAASLGAASLGAASLGAASLGAASLGAASLGAASPGAAAAKPARKRLTRQEVARRDDRIFRMLAAGVSVVDIARRQKATPRRVRERLAAVFARRERDNPADYAQVQIQRLNEAMLVAWSAMGGGNLKAVDRVVRITRELDRYHGFTAPRPASPPLAALAPPLRLASPADALLSPFDADQAGEMDGDEPRASASLNEGF